MNVVSRNAPLTTFTAGLKFQLIPEQIKIIKRSVQWASDALLTALKNAVI